jgi:uncharacterized membrane-anchored protein
MKRQLFFATYLGLWAAVTAAVISRAQPVGSALVLVVMAALGAAFMYVGFRLVVMRADDLSLSMKDSKRMANKSRRRTADCRR